jgi:hypothetical protein
VHLARPSSVAISVSFVLAIAWSSPASAAWTETEVRDFGDSDSETSSLVLSPSGRPFVAWQRRGSNDLFWAKRTANGWDRTEVAKDPDFTQCYTSENPYVGPSATFAPNGTPRIASVCIAVGGGSPVLYTTQTATGRWKTLQVGRGASGTSCDSSATDVDIANDPGGKPFIVMTDQCTKKVVGFYRQNNDWRRVTMLSPGSLAPFMFGAISVATDPTSGRLAMALNTDVYGRGQLLIEAFTWRGVWLQDAEVVVTPLPDGNAVYGEPDLRFTQDGTGYLAFQAGSAYGTPAADQFGFLGLMTRDSGIWSPPATIDDAVTVTGADPTLWVSSDLLHVAYRDETNGDLRYATSSDGTSWTAETVFGPHDTGLYPDLIVTPGGIAHLTYHDSSSTALMSTKGP